MVARMEQHVLAAMPPFYMPMKYDIEKLFLHF